MLQHIQVKISSRQRIKSEGRGLGDDPDLEIMYQMVAKVMGQKVGVRMCPKILPTASTNTYSSRPRTTPS